MCESVKKKKKKKCESVKKTKPCILLMKGDLVVCSNAGQMLTRLLLLFCYLILLNFFPVKLYGLQDNDPSMLHTQYHKIFQEMLQEYLFWILVILCDPKSFLLQVHFISRGGFISKGMNYLATVI